MSGKDPRFAERWRQSHFDPYLEYSERKLAERCIQNKKDRELTRGFGPHPKGQKTRAIIHSVQTKRAKSHPVTIPQLWKP